MKTLQNNFTTPEQSKRLLELGVPADSADCAVRSSFYNHGIVVINRDYTYTKWTKEVYNFQTVSPYLPCWSAGRLAEIFETCTNYRIYRFDFTGTYIERLIKMFEYVVEANHIDFSKLEN